MYKCTQGLETGDVMQTILTMKKTASKGTLYDPMMGSEVREQVPLAVQVNRQKLALISTLIF
jgi:hypothetical protein